MNNLGKYQKENKDTLTLDKKLNRRSFLAKSITSVTALTLSRFGLATLASTSLMLRSKAHAALWPVIGFIGRGILRFLGRVAVAVVSDLIVNSVVHASAAPSQKSVLVSTSQANTGGYRHEVEQTFELPTDTVQVSSSAPSHAYVLNHDDEFDCCAVFLNPVGEAIYINGPVASAFATASDVWETFLRQNPSMAHISAKDALLPVAPSNEQNTRHNFSQSFPVPKRYPTRAGYVLVDYQSTAYNQGNLSFHVFANNQEIYWDKYFIQNPS